MCWMGRIVFGFVIDIIIGEVIYMVRYISLNSVGVFFGCIGYFVY